MFTLTPTDRKVIVASVLAARLPAMTCTETKFAMKRRKPLTADATPAECVWMFTQQAFERPVSARFVAALRR